MRRILALLGDYWHCSDQLLLAVQSVGLPDDASLEVIRYPDIVDPLEIAGYDLVIFAMMGQLRPRESDEQWYDSHAQAALADRVAGGAGLLVVHAGTASHPQDGPLRALVGGHFLHHPPEHPVVTISPVADHPITRGVSPFGHPDEHYFMQVDSDVTPLLEASSTLGTQPAGWCKQYGDGRVAVIVPGHTREMLEEPMLRAALANAVNWCLKQEL
ncbi:MAG: ThuA domain-containing protein [Spirochaetota bacterium]